ncbi:MAG: hypothetical protein AAF318_01475 [Pseudomonadota bacterium]
MDLLALHRLAAPFGEGLHPTLAAAFSREAQLEREGVVRFQPPVERNPPTHQPRPEGDLKSLGIATLTPNAPARHNGQADNDAQPLAAPALPDPHGRFGPLR